MPANKRLPVAPPTDSEREAARVALTWLEASRTPFGSNPLPPTRLGLLGNSGRSVPLPPSATALLLEVLRNLAEGRAVTVAVQESELTTQQVADHLKVSRPYVVRLIEENRLPARKVGSRRRVTLQDLLRFEEQQRARSRAALDELARIDRELGL
jgi:excisionase family DNA binding protein